MKKTNDIISFRFLKGNFFNKIKQSKLPIDFDKIILGSHQSCPACGFNQAWLIATVDRVGFLCDTVVCKQCQLVFNDSYIAEPETFYSEMWGEERWGDPNENFLKRTRIDAFSWHRFVYVSKKLNGKLSNVKNVLQIGCGDGCNLFPYHLNGYEVTGLDYDDKFLEPGRKTGMNLFIGDIFNNKLKSKYDLILLIHSFEHMQDLDNVIIECKKYIKTNGFVYVEVPGIINWNRVRSKRLTSGGMSSGNNFLGYLQFQHNYHFDAHHLKWFWERNGFETIQLDEWVRALFKSSSDQNNLNQNVENHTNYDFDIVKHLKKVEKNFLSVSNQFKRPLRYMLKKIT